MSEAWQKLGWDERLLVYAGYNTVDGTYPYWAVTPSLHDHDPGTVRAHDARVHYGGATSRDGVTHYCVSDLGNFKLSVVKIDRTTKRVVARSSKIYNNHAIATVFLSTDETELYIENLEFNIDVFNTRDLSYVRTINRSQSANRLIATCPNGWLLCENALVYQNGVIAGNAPSLTQAVFSPSGRVFAAHLGPYSNDNPYRFGAGIKTKANIADTENGTPYYSFASESLFMSCAVSRDGLTLYGLEYIPAGASNFKLALWMWDVSNVDPTQWKILKKQALQFFGGSPVPYFRLVPMPPLKMGVVQECDILYEAKPDVSDPTATLGFQRVRIYRGGKVQDVFKKLDTHVVTSMWFDNSRRFYAFYRYHYRKDPKDFGLAGFSKNSPWLVVEITKRGASSDGLLDGLGRGGEVWSEDFSNGSMIGGRSGIFYACAVKVETMELIFKKSFDNAKTWLDEVVVGVLEYGEVFNITEYSSIGEIALTAPSGKRFFSSRLGNADSWKEITPETPNTTPSP